MAIAVIILTRITEFLLQVQPIEALSQVSAITDQTNHKEIVESVAKQRFQQFPWFGFERKAL
ncbi:MULTISPECIES: hypothetical protein [Pseudanabaena]|uniref:Uncharacterized protein n=1 Tax=Pseudanabaena catenata USMAC16 TaxID=1855837 RepID=A0A9X4RHB6_9CYAN|nr:MULTISPECIES: hypothetical protein [Pseudanabaena]MDG3494311.1 hypothetical protein [Pseudanabaena catenata USMAC16]